MALGNTILARIRHFSYSWYWNTGTVEHVNINDNLTGRHYNVIFSNDKSEVIYFNFVITISYIDRHGSLMFP